MFAGDIAAGHGVMVIDLHPSSTKPFWITTSHAIGQTMSSISIAKIRSAPSRSTCSNARGPSRRGSSSRTPSAFSNLWTDSWGPRMEDILRNGLHALIEQPLPVSILALPKQLTDQNYRTDALAAV